MTQLRWLWLAALPWLAGAQTVEFGADGAWQLARPVPIRGSLFLWHDQWKYSTPQQVTRQGDAVTGWLKASEAGAKLTFRIVSERQGQGLHLRYTVRRDAGVKLSDGLFLLVQLPLEPVQERVIRFTHSSPALVRGGFTGAGTGFDFNLDNQSAFRLTSDHFLDIKRRGDSPQTVSINVRLLPRDFPADQDVTVVVDAGLVAAGPERLPWQMKETKAPAIRTVTPRPATVPQNDTATVDVDAVGTFTNPFDPAQIALDAQITYPDGSRHGLPGYWQQDYDAQMVGRNEVLQARGEPGWRFRFTPPLAGSYQVVVTLTNAGQRVVAPPVTITATPSKLPGTLRIGRHGNVFVHDNGGSVFLIGHNVPTYLTGPQTMAQCFDQMVAGGENFTRLWMYSTHLGLEWSQPLGTYRLEEAWRLDNALRLAWERGVQVLLCLDTHQDFIDPRFRQNPYHKASGGPIDTPLDFFRDDAARQAYRNRLRYLVARWSHCTNLVAWEFANEIEGWKGFKENQDVVAKWHSEMAATIRGLDPQQHPISTSCWTTAGWPALWTAPGIDFVQIHHYANTKVNMAQRTADVMRQNRRDYPHKLLLFAEMGIDSRFSPGQGDDQDPTGVHLHEQSWSALFEGSASVPVNWWHESYIDPHNLYGRFKAISRFTADLDLDRAWQPTGDLPLDWIQRPADLKPDTFELDAAGDAWRKPATTPRFVLGNDGSFTDRDKLPRLMQGRGHQDVQFPWEFVLDQPQDGKFILHVGRCSNNPRLIAELDGRRVLDRVFVTGKGLGLDSVYREQWKLWETLYDTDVELAIPAGKHVLKLTNDGADWLTVDRLAVTNYLTHHRPFGTAQGLTDGRELLLWVRNGKYWWLPVAKQETTPALAPTRVTLPDLPAGAYRLEQWDTARGEVVSRTTLTLTGHQDRLDLPAIRTDIAWRLRPGG